eukprot:UN02530
MFKDNRDVLDKMKGEALQSMDRLEELTKKITDEVEKTTDPTAGMSKTEKMMYERMQRLNGGSAATTKPAAATTTAAASTTTQINIGEPSELSLQYTQQHNKQPLKGSTIGMENPINLSDLSRNLFTPAGADSGATSPKLSEEELQRRAEMYESIGAVFPGQAADAPKHTSYTDSVLRPHEKPKFADCKRLHLPTSLIKAFKLEAEADLRKDIETCGLLYGHKYHDEWVVKGLVLPEQIGEYDRCCTVNEENIIDVVQTRGYVILGWIHTHPKFEAFLSSIDLHCQASYQSQIPEAIAIVVSECTNTNAIFTLSQQGLQELKSCTIPANTFHRHNQKVPLFDNAQHVVLHYPQGHERFHKETGDVIIPPPPSGIGVRLYNWIVNEGLKRYECEIFDLRRGKNNERYYIYPTRAKDPGRYGPSGGHDIIRKQPAKPYNPHSHQPPSNHNNNSTATNPYNNSNAYNNPGAVPNYGGYDNHYQQQQPQGYVAPTTGNNPYGPSYQTHNNKTSPNGYAAQHYAAQQQQAAVAPGYPPYPQQPGVSPYQQQQQQQASPYYQQASANGYNPAAGGYRVEPRGRY